MSIIKGLSGLSNEFLKLNDDKKTKKAESPAKSNITLAKSNSSSNLGKDSVKISSTGKDMLEQQKQVEMYEENLKQIQTLGKKELLNVHNKISSNYYSKPEVLAKIVENIIPQNIEDFEAVEESATPEKFNKIQENIANKVYDSDEVIDVIADKLLNSEPS